MTLKGRHLIDIFDPIVSEVILSHDTQGKPVFSRKGLPIDSIGQEDLVREDMLKGVSHHPFIRRGWPPNFHMGNAVLDSGHSKQRHHGYPLPIAVISEYPGTNEEYLSFDGRQTEDLPVGQAQWPHHFSRNFQTPCVEVDTQIGWSHGSEIVQWRDLQVSRIQFGGIAVDKALPRCPLGKDDPLRFCPEATGRGGEGGQEETYAGENLHSTEEKLSACIHLSPLITCHDNPQPLRLECA